MKEGRFTKAKNNYVSTIANCFIVIREFNIWKNKTKQSEKSKGDTRAENSRTKKKNREWLISNAKT